MLSPRLAEVIGVSVQELILLDEVDEHQPVEHQGGIRLTFVRRRNSVDELEERGVLSLEPLVESAGGAREDARRPARP